MTANIVVSDGVIFDLNLMRRGRTQVHDSALHVKLPSDAKAALEAIAQANGVPVALLVRGILADWLGRADDVVTVALEPAQRA